MNKRKRRTLFAALASVVFLTVCTSAYLNYGFNRDVVATPEDFDISMEVLEMPGNENASQRPMRSARAIGIFTPTAGAQTGCWAAMPCFPAGPLKNSWTTTLCPN